jgi:hypothetical protein
MPVTGVIDVSSGSGTGSGWNSNMSGAGSRSQVARRLASRSCVIASSASVISGASRTKHDGGWDRSGADATRPPRSWPCAGSLSVKASRRYSIATPSSTARQLGLNRTVGHPVAGRARVRHRMLDCRAEKPVFGARKDGARVIHVAPIAR